ISPLKHRSKMHPFAWAFPLDPRLSDALVKKVVRCATPTPLGFACEPFEVLEHGRNQLLSPGVVCGRCMGKQIEQISRLLGSFVPVCSRRCHEMRFQFFLSKTQ